MKNPEHLRPFRPDQPVILVAEDEVMVQNLVRITLEGAGYFVLTAHDGQEAIELSHQYTERIHLLITDVLMPRMDGYQLCEQILQERPGTAVLLISGTHHPGARVPYLAKPFTSYDLCAAVGRIIAAPSHAQVPPVPSE
jgi:CheY-like chemotaxis protein